MAKLSIVWKFVRDGFKRDKVTALSFVLLWIGTFLGMLCYEIYQPEFYLGSRASRVIPFFIWIYLPLIIVCVIGAAFSAHKKSINSGDSE